MRKRTQSLALWHLPQSTKKACDVRRGAAASRFWKGGFFEGRNVKKKSAPSLCTTGPTGQRAQGWGAMGRALPRSVNALTIGKFRGEPKIFADFDSRSNPPAPG